MLFLLTSNSHKVVVVVVAYQVVPWEKLEPGPVVTLKRVVATLRVLTFFCGWNRMMWTLGAKRQPNTTDPLRLTEMHMVVVCTWRRKERWEIQNTNHSLASGSYSFSFSSYSIYCVFHRFYITEKQTDTCTDKRWENIDPILISHQCQY